MLNNKVTNYILFWTYRFFRVLNSFSKLYFSDLENRNNKI